MISEQTWDEVHSEPKIEKGLMPGDDDYENKFTKGGFAEFTPIDG